MRFEALLPAGRRVVVEKNFWTTQTEIRLDNVVIGRSLGNSKEPVKFKSRNGKEHSLMVKHEVLDPMPRLLLDGTDLFASERFGALQTAIICVPVLLILQLGAIPALIGVGSVYVNYFVARRDNLPMTARWAVIAVVPVIGFVAITALSTLVWGGENSKKSHASSTQPQTSSYEDPPEWSTRKPTQAQLDAERYTLEGK